MTMQLTPFYVTVDGQRFSTGEGDWWIPDEGLEGWYDSPDSDAEFFTIPGDDGALEPAEVTLAAREITFVGRHIASSMGVAKGEVLAWAAALAKRNGFTFAVDDETGVKTARVWLQRGQRVRTRIVLDAYVEFMLTLIAPDPRKYGTTDKPIVVDATPSIADGLAFPLFEAGALELGPFVTIGDFGITTFALWNGGTAESWPVYRLRGPIQSGFSILTEGGELRYAQGLAASAKLTLSPYAGGRAVLDGVDVTEQLTVADWVPVSPQERRQFQIVPAGIVSGGAGIEIDFREAWY